MSDYSTFENTLIQLNFKMLEDKWWDECHHSTKTFRVFFQEDNEYLFYDNISTHDIYYLTSVFLEWIRYDGCKSCVNEHLEPLICSGNYNNIRIFQIINDMEVSITNDYGCIEYPINPNDIIWQPEDDYSD